VSAIVRHLLLTSNPILEKEDPGTSGDGVANLSEFLSPPAGSPRNFFLLTFSFIEISLSPYFVKSYKSLGRRIDEYKTQRKKIILIFREIF
jgi:hypothetical protein